MSKLSDFISANKEICYRVADLNTKIEKELTNMEFNGILFIDEGKGKDVTRIEQDDLSVGFYNNNQLLYKFAKKDIRNTDVLDHPVWIDDIPYSKCFIYELHGFKQIRLYTDLQSKIQQKEEE